MLKLIFEMNGLAEFKLKRASGGEWSVEDVPGSEGKPRFVLYTGTESIEEKEIVRNIYNNSWEFVPPELAASLRLKYENNLYGAAIKVLMITAAGAEGINLKNTRFVHIVEPHWHMVRTEQVVGRARRICSHEELPEAQRTVKVFIYLSVFSNAQKTDDKNIELRIRDVSREDGKTPLTMDEILFEGAVIKDRINQQVLRAVKETAMDCSLYAAGNKKENLVCYGFGAVRSNNFSSMPTLEGDMEDTSEGAVVRTEELVLQSVTLKGVLYKIDRTNNNLYDAKSVERAKTHVSDLQYMGRLVQQDDGYVIDTEADRYA
jgi:hypothetical protein